MCGGGVVLVRRRDGLDLRLFLYLNFLNLLTDHDWIVAANLFSPKLTIIERAFVLV